MKNIYSLKIKPDIPDNEVVFQDGILFIICAYGTEEDCECHQIHIDAQYRPETVMSLKDIVEKYPTVSKVIHEGMLYGEVYSYGNHKMGEWEKVGETIGYA